MLLLKNHSYHSYENPHSSPLSPPWLLRRQSTASSLFKQVLTGEAFSDDEPPGLPQREREAVTGGGECYGSGGVA